MNERTNECMNERTDAWMHGRMDGWMDESWRERHTAELFEMASKDSSGFWKASKTQKHDVCPKE